MNGILKGNGTQFDPYVLEDGFDVAAIKNNVFAYYILEQNIDMSSYNTKYTSGLTPIINFYGVIDGKGHYISNFTILTSNTVATFIQDLYGTIKNLGLINVNISSESNNAYGFAGTVGTQAIVENCFITGNIQGLGSYTSSFFHNVTNGNTQCKNLFSTANIIGTTYLSGIAYSFGNSCILKNTYFAGKFITTGTARSYLYGITATIPTIKDCYYNIDTTGNIVNNSIGVAYNTNDFFKASNFSAYLDEKYAENRPIWDIQDGKYPLFTYLTDNKYLIKSNNSYMTIENDMWKVISTDTSVNPTTEQFNTYGLNNFEVSMINRVLWNELRKFGQFQIVSQVNRYEWVENHTLTKFTKWKEIPGAVLYKAPIDVSKLTKDLINISIIQEDIANEDE